MNAVIGGLAALLYLFAGGLLALRLAQVSSQTGGITRWPAGARLERGAAAHPDPGPDRV